MRFFFIVVVLLLVVGYIGFTVTNLGSVVSLKLWGTEYQDIPIWQVVIVSIGVGAALIGLLATVEGASIRFENRRLRKELHKMERELNFLRTTQPGGDRAPEPDAIEDTGKPALPAPAAATLSEPAEVLVQVNMTGDKKKYGVAPAAVRHLIEQIDTMFNLRVRGLMCMGPQDGTPDDVRHVYDRTRELYDDIRRQGIASANFNILSMGMSHDFELAIECGANVVRVGTAIFGNTSNAP